MISRLASFVSVSVVFGMFLLMSGGGVDDVHGTNIRSALLTKTHTPAPPPPFRECSCSSSPCHNGGECTDIRVGSGISATIYFECECRDLWEGDVCHTCDTTSNEILCSNICNTRKNGICEDGGDGSVSPSLCDLGTDCEDCHARCIIVDSTTVAPARI